MKFVDYWKLGSIPIEYANELLRCRPTYLFSLPREVVADSPVQLLRALKSWPTGRGWFLHKWELNRRYVSYEEICRDTNFTGTSHYPSLHIVEYWADYGDDGHTEYKLMGHILYTSTEYEVITAKKITELVSTLDWSKFG